ncbi:hypothetical protein GCM10022278_11440 [Allohahella marinimesophila]|uniref:SMI1/KNR4 family protein n=1 Tax=Allohahella marinimesophila TaxID=1054972 RepID=A0ABP7NW70_9GAMM
MKLKYVGRRHGVSDYEEQAKLFEEMSGYKVPASYLAFLREHGTGSLADPSVFEDCCQIVSRP